MSDYRMSPYRKDMDPPQPPVARPTTRWLVIRGKVGWICIAVYSTATAIAYSKEIPLPDLIRGLMVYGTSCCVLLSVLRVMPVVALIATLYYRRQRDWVMVGVTGLTFVSSAAYTYNHYCFRLIEGLPLFP